MIDPLTTNNVICRDSLTLTSRQFPEKTKKKTRTSFKKPGYRFSVESTKIENATIQNCPVRSQIEWDYDKERSFASKYSFFFDNFVSV